MADKMAGQVGGQAKERNLLDRIHYITMIKNNDRLKFFVMPF